MTHASEDTMIVGKRRFLEDAIARNIVRWVNGREDASEFAFQVPEPADADAVRRILDARRFTRDFERPVAYKVQEYDADGIPHEILVTVNE